MTKQLVIILIVLAAVAAVAQPPGPAADKREGSLSFRREPPQTEFPVQIVEAMFGDTLAQLLIVNLSSREVEQVTVGVLLEDKAWPAPVTRSGKACITSVPPEGFLLVKTANTGFDGADAYFRSKGITQKEVSVGVTQVRLAGGMEWTYPLDAKGRFEGEGDKDIGERVGALVQKAFGRPWSGVFVDPSAARKVSTCRE